MKKYILALLLLPTTLYAHTTMPEAFYSCSVYHIYWNKYTNYITITDANGTIRPVTTYWISNDHIIMYVVSANEKHRYEINRNNGKLRYEFYLNHLNEVPNNTNDFQCYTTSQPYMEYKTD
jgi:hypothetical protein